MPQATLRTLMCVLAVALFAQLSGVAQVCAFVRGHAAVDLCASGCEDQGDSAPCSPACPTCSCAPMARGVAPPVDVALAQQLLHQPSPAITGRLLAAPSRVDGDGVFHPPRV